MGRKESNQTNKQNFKGLCLLTFLYDNAKKQWIEVCDRHIITAGFGYNPQIQPSTFISPGVKALRLIMRFCVDILDNNQILCDDLIDWPMFMQ